MQHHPSTFLLHGLCLRSQIAVPGAASAPAAAQVDFDVRIGDAVDVPDSPPPGELVAALGRRGAGYAAALRDDVLTIRYFAVGDFEVDLAAGTMRVRPTPGAAAAMVPVLLASNVLGIMLGLRGAAVLHASAVELDGIAVAFVGGLGAGKSTAAGLMCSEGARLVTDDAAHVDLGEEDIFVHRGAGELRLRTHAAGFASRLDGPSRTTADERVAVSVRRADAPVVPLGAIVFPTWTREPRGPSLTALTRREALDALLRYPLVTGWQVPGPTRAHFDAAVRLAERIPAFSAELPWGAADGDVALRERLETALASALVR